MFVLRPVFKNTYFTFFSDFKEHDFSFFEMRYQKVVIKSLVLMRQKSKRVHILRSVITNSIPSSQSVIHSESLLNMLVDRIDYSEQSTNAFITHSSPRRLMLVTVTYWPLKLYVRFLRILTYFSQSKKHDFLRIFELMHTYSRTLSTIVTVSYTHLTLPTKRIV